MSTANRKVRVGTVVSDKMDKTVVVVVEWRSPHPLYKKPVRRRTRFYAHDEKGQCRVGDLVRIVETRPLSKTKRWRVAEVLARVEIAEIQPEEIGADVLAGLEAAGAAPGVAEMEAPEVAEAFAEKAVAPEEETVGDDVADEGTPVARIGAEEGGVTPDDFTEPEASPPVEEASPPEAEEDDAPARLETPAVEDQGDETAPEAGEEAEDEERAGG